MKVHVKARARYKGMSLIKTNVNLNLWGDLMINLRVYVFRDFLVFQFFLVLCPT